MLRKSRHAVISARNRYRATDSEHVSTVQGSGTYVFFYKPTVAGKYQVSVRLGRGDVPGSPFESIVHPGKTDTKHCGVSGLGLLCAGASPTSPYPDALLFLCMIASDSSAPVDSLRSSSLDPILFTPGP